MKQRLLCLSFCCLAIFANGQQKIIDSIKQKMPSGNDTLNLVWCSLLGEAYNEVNMDSVEVYDKKYVSLCKKLKFSLQQADALAQQAAYTSIGNPGAAMNLLSLAQNIVEQPTGSSLLPPSYLILMKVPENVSEYPLYKEYVKSKIKMGFGGSYFLSFRNKKGLEYFRQALAIAQTLNVPALISSSCTAIGLLNESTDSAFFYLKKARQIAIDNHLASEQSYAENFLAQVYSYQNDFKFELYYRQSSLAINIRYGKTISTGWSYIGMADYYARSVINKDSVLFYAYKAIDIANQSHLDNIIYWSSKYLSEIYKNEGNKDSAYKYLEKTLLMKEKISDDNTTRQFDDIAYTSQLQQSAVEEAKRQLQNKIKTYSFIAGLAIVALLAIIFWRNNKRKQREYLVLQKQKAKTEEALQNLKLTQQQLIQSEKMASLGELTAGIAHEIQNPLNFVNNFSEVNRELIEELLNERSKVRSERDEQLEVDILNDIKANEEKINHHGKRADAIVKGMLQHSGKSEGKKEPTDINKLADEYLRLSYHGMRAKDKSFNADFKTDFDESIGKINIVPQDIGRVLLNLYNNAFYATNEKLTAHRSLLIDNYKPLVSVQTKKINSPPAGGVGGIEITVKDNGSGISQNIVDKIFQPFFTTKPTGQGTGLGLSLSYDIVKAHGGEIKVESKEEEGSEFIIQLPV